MIRKVTGTFDGPQDRTSRGPSCRSSVGEVDHIAVEEFSLSILQMMENAGRNLAENVLAMLGGIKGEITLLAGSGGNGGGGLCLQE